LETFVLAASFLAHY